MLIKHDWFFIYSIYCVYTDLNIFKQMKYEFQHHKKMYFLSGSFKSFYFRKVSLEVFAEPARVEGDKEVRAAEVGWERRNYGSVMRESGMRGEKMKEQIQD